LGEAESSNHIGGNGMTQEREYEKQLDFASRCKNCGMCRIDYLGSGRCDAGQELVYAGHHPQGRLKVFKRLVENGLPLTQELSNIVNSCTLCGKCNIQCFFQVEMIPAIAFAAKKQIFANMLEHEELLTIEEDQVLRELRAVVGERWATNDPAMLASYATFGSLSSQEKIPAYVVLPLDASQTSQVVQLANKHGIGFLPVSSGTNSSNLSADGVILIDMNRMKTLDINQEERYADVGAGVIAFDLQQAAMKIGLRFSIGESAAGVCANQVSTGIHSFFAYKNGMMSDHYIKAEMVLGNGDIVSQSSAEAPQIPTSPEDDYRPVLRHICTKLRIKLYPIAANETVVVIPFKEMSEGLATLKGFAQQELGAGLGLIGVEVLASFLTINQEDTENFLDIARDYLRIHHVILMLLDETDLATIRRDYPALTIIERESMRKVILGVPAINGPEAMALIEECMDEEKPYDHIFGEMLEYFLQQIELTPDEIHDIFSYVEDGPLRNALVRRYSSEQFSDPFYWFNYRMFSPRFMRSHWFFSVMHFADSADIGLVEEICAKYREFGEIHEIQNEFCYIMPLDGGQRFFFEYEFFCDQRNAEELSRLKKVFFLLAYDTKKMVKSGRGLYPVLNTLFNGASNRHGYLYSNLNVEV
jgi:hypothetical protein